MKRNKLSLGLYGLPVLILFIMTGCSKDTVDDPAFQANVIDTIYNVSYGTDAQQTLDLYLPEGRTKDKTRVFVVIHGGGWTAGDKNDMKDFFNSLIKLYPDHAVANINYRLATNGSPGNPKQIEDIKSVISFLQKAEYNLDNEYFMMGTSAGGHLAMLYSYGFDPKQEVKALCNIVGPCDFTDPSYTENILLLGVLNGYTGTWDYANNKELFKETSPVNYIKTASPPTIAFFGDTDPLIPLTQKNILEASLKAANVPNEMYVYAGGHGNWSQNSYNDMLVSLIAFKNKYFN